jgi:hypothetical protein
MNDPSAWVAKDEDKYDLERHKRERAENGFSVFDWWNFNSYLAWVNIQGLKKFKEEGSGYPANSSLEEWNEMLDIMIEGFEAFETYMNDCPDSREEIEALLATHRVGMKLYAEQFVHLWD